MGTLINDPFGNVINHSCATTAWLSSPWKTQGDAIRMNIAPGGGKTVANQKPPDSIDQVIANYIGITPGSSLVLNLSQRNLSEKQMGGHLGAISYNTRLAASGSTILPRIASPMNAFNSLFGSCKPTTTTTTPQVDPRPKSILDYVINSIPNFKTKLSSADKARFDSYLQYIRDLEVKLTPVNTGGGTSTKSCPKAPIPTPGGALDYVTTLNMMVDVVALAVASGTMPIATLMLDSDATGDARIGSSVSYMSNYIGINGKRAVYHNSTLDTHNGITHVENGSSNVQAIEEHIAYTQFCMSFTKRLIQTLDSMPVEPNGFTPLDNTLILSGSCQSNPYHHSTHNLPTLLAGGKRYGMNQGKHLVFPMKTDIGNLYYSMMRAMGVPGTSFNGNSTVLSGIFG